MKVLFLCPSLVGAGVERKVCILLKELGRLNVDVRLGLLREEGEFLNELPASRRVFVLPNPWLKRLLLGPLRSRDLVNCVIGIFQIRRMLQTIKPNIVVSFTLETTIPMYFVAGRKCAGRAAWIISEDSNTAAATLESCSSILVGGLLQFLLGKIYRKASHINCVSSSVQDTVRQFYRIDRSRLSSLPNPVEIARVKRLIAKPLNPAIDSDFIVSVGRLVVIKQFDLLIRAFAEVRKSRKIKLVILGEGPERENLCRLAVEIGLARDILLLGFVRNPWSYMARAKLLVLTSKLEGFGNVIVESMAAGCPVIATRCGGPEEVIRETQNGILVKQNIGEIANAIHLVLDDPRLSERLVRNAQIQVKNYSPAKISVRFESLLQQVAVEQGL